MTTSISWWCRCSARAPRQRAPHRVTAGNRWQIDLDDGELFDFCGVRKTREIVIEFLSRSETRQHLE
jgi:hypothetical protein